MSFYIAHLDCRKMSGLISIGLSLLFLLPMCKDISVIHLLQMLHFVDKQYGKKKQKTNHIYNSAEILVLLLYAWLWMQLWRKKNTSLLNRTTSSSSKNLNVHILHAVSTSLLNTILSGSFQFTGVNFSFPPLMGSDSDKSHEKWYLGGSIPHTPILCSQLWWKLLAWCHKTLTDAQTTRDPRNHLRTRGLCQWQQHNKDDALIRLHLNCFDYWP